jgi:hypothetical protein
MTQRTVERITAGAGIGVVVVIIAAVSTIANPQLTDPLSRTTDSYVTHSSKTFLNVTLFLLWALPVLIFVAGLRSILRRAEGESDILSMIAFGSAVATEGWVMLFGAVNATLALAAGRASPSEVKLLVALEYVVDQLTFLVLGIFVGAASLAILSTRAFPRWMGWIGAVSGALFVSSNVSMLDPAGPIGNAGSLGMVGLLLLLIWAIAISVSLLRHRAVAADSRPASAGTEQVPG